MTQIDKAVQAIQQGGVIAYPTEAVYGLGCDPFSEKAVSHVLNLKQRNVSKGLILIAASWAQIHELTRSIPEERLQAVLQTWPGPYTWVLPASDKVPKWITGEHDGVALRVTAHPVTRALCQQLGGPLVSTSANIEGQPPAKNVTDVFHYFANRLHFVIEGQVGHLSAPTPIYDALTNKQLR